MPENKTKPTTASVTDYLLTIQDEKRQKEAFDLLELFTEATGEEPYMYGTSIVGFGVYHYTYDSGHSGVACHTGFSSRTGKFALYVSGGQGLPPELLTHLGKHKMTKACLYINKLADIDLEVLRELIAWAYTENKQLWPN